MKKIILGIAVTAIFAGFTSCESVPNSPGFEFMPDMYRSPSLDYYGTHVINGDTLQGAKLPAEGTISRGHMPGIPHGMSYEEAGLNLKNPIPLSDAVLADGEALYGKYCIHCHGDAGKGDGKVGAKLPGAPPAFDGPLKNLPEGKMFYTITNGKGLMGAHASYFSVEERWKLVHYVQKLQGPKVVVADSSAVAGKTK